MNHEEIKASLAAYSLDALEAGEKRTVEAHLAQGCEECQVLLREMTEVVSLLPYEISSQQPPAYLKQRILSRVGQQQATSAKQPVVVDPITTRRAYDPPKWRWATLGLSLALIVQLMVIAWLVLDGQQTRQRLERITVQNHMSDEVIKQLRIELAAKERQLRVLRSEGVRLVELKGQEPAAESYGRVLWDPQTRQAVFLASGLPPAAFDQDYQLWMLRGSQPVDAGVVTIREDGSIEHSLLIISDTENLSAFAVTIEPKGGVPQPTGAIYLLGTVDAG